MGNTRGWKSEKVSSVFCRKWFHQLKIVKIMRIFLYWFKFLSIAWFPNFIIFVPSYKHRLGVVSCMWRLELSYFCFNSRDALNNLDARQLLINRHRMKLHWKKWYPKKLKRNKKPKCCTMYFVFYNEWAGKDN